jgi:hypothetical protein
LSDSDARHPVYYTNQVTSHVSSFDFTLVFGLTSPDEDDPVRTVAQVYMSPQLAQALHELLGRMIEVYQSNVDAAESSDIDVQIEGERHE